MIKHLRRELLDAIFGYGCAAIRHAGACRLMNWWVNTSLYERLWRQ